MDAGSAGGYSCWARDGGPVNIADPYNRPAESYQLCFTQVQRAVSLLVADLQAGAGNRGPGVTGKNELPFFSIILPTRNRPQLFRAALDSVLGQAFTELEVLVVNDGSSDEFLPSYQAMQAEYDERVKWHYQPQRPNGHGQSYSMNAGAYHARVNTLRSWTMTMSGPTATTCYGPARRFVPPILPPMCFTATRPHLTVPAGKYRSKVWIADLAEKVSPGMLVADDAYQVSTDFLLESAGFAPQLHHYPALALPGDERHGREHTL